jgi:hypothetical protein
MKNKISKFTQLPFGMQYQMRAKQNPVTWRERGGFFISKYKSNLVILLKLIFLLIRMKNVIFLNDSNYNSNKTINAKSNFFKKYYY